MPCKSSRKDLQGEVWCPTCCVNEVEPSIDGALVGQPVQRQLSSVRVSIKVGSQHPDRTYNSVAKSTGHSNQQEQLHMTKRPAVQLHAQVVQRQGMDAVNMCACALDGHSPDLILSILAIAVETPEGGVTPLPGSNGQ